MTLRDDCASYRKANDYYLYKHFSDMIHPEFTARVEKDLDLISLGKLDWILMIGKIYNVFNKKKSVIFQS